MQKCKESVKSQFYDLTNVINMFHNKSRSKFAHQIVSTVLSAQLEKKSPCHLYLLKFIVYFQPVFALPT